MNTDHDYIQQSIRESVAHARTMPIQQAIDYLRGLLILAGDQAEVAATRNVFIQLTAVDANLYNLQTGQQELPLPKPMPVTNGLGQEELVWNHLRQIQEALSRMSDPNAQTILTHVISLKELLTPAK